VLPVHPNLLRAGPMVRPVGPQGPCPQSPFRVMLVTPPSEVVEKREKQRPPPFPNCTLNDCGRIP